MEMSEEDSVNDQCQSSVYYFMDEGATTINRLIDWLSTFQLTVNYSDDVSV